MDIETYLKDAGAGYEKHEHVTAYTAQELAAEEHVSGHAVAKSVLVVADGRDVLCVLPACCKIDLKKLAKVLRAKKCRLADEAELAKVFPDVEVGAEPPFGEPYGLTTVVDEQLAGCEAITFNAGSHHEAIRMSYADYARIAKPDVHDVSVHLAT